jgi:hypothetical protein
VQHESKTAARLERIRGTAPPRRHNARTIAALTSNPGCGRRAVLDAAGVDKEALASRVGHPAGFGQSPFAIARGNVFERQVKADGCAELLRLLRQDLDLDLGQATYRDLGADGELAAGTGHPADEAAAPRGRPAAAGGSGLLAPAGGGRGLEAGGWAARHAGAVAALTRAVAVAGSPAGILFDHPLLRLDVAGQEVSLEPDLVAVESGGLCHIVEIKSFPVIDGQADGEKVAAAAVQAAVYVLALRRLLGGPDAVAPEVVLVCPKDFSNVPVATRLDVRRQLLVLEHQLARLTRIDSLLDAVPDDLRLDPTVDAAGQAVLDGATLTEALARISARYVPGCLSSCELAFFCRGEAAGRTVTLGVGVREDLGGLDTVADALGLAHGTRAPDADQVETAAILRTAARVYAESLTGVPGPRPRPVPGQPVPAPDAAGSGGRAT